ncbi:cyclopropane fatty acid synthase [Microbacterium testaceum StLB037]|uniref:Cyclopropane fatty acid synthase n=1 Tax=Microbacterium testaceum (strain StLB037) TaxID=979556 RepID=E8N9P9_MICTS|nr:cyclopropane fatty acid synthase [Microbacterium testaceum StLB037]
MMAAILPPSETQPSWRRRFVNALAAVASSGSISARASNGRIPGIRPPTVVIEDHVTEEDSAERGGIR